MRNRLGGKGETGAAALEFAIVSALFLSLIWGIFTFGFIFGLDQSITNAASEGARAAIAAATPSDQIDLARHVAWERMPQWIRDRLDFDTHVLAEIVPCDASSCIKVTIVYPWKERPVVPSILSVAAPEVITAFSIVELDRAIPAPPPPGGGGGGSSSPPPAPLPTLTPPGGVL